MSDPVERPRPLFYRKPQPLIPAIHGDVRLLDGDLSFAATTNAIPIVTAEFASAMRHYPIVFAENSNFPLAVLGLGKINRFVADGRWSDGHYIPAYVRRYPFVFADAGEQGFALALDVMSERVAQSDGEGVALFEGNEPSAFTRNAMAFCRDFHRAHLGTAAFVEALREHDLLVSRQADAKLASGGPMTLGGFRVVDRERLAHLPDDTILDWQRKGWLELASFHMASLDRFAELLDREARAIDQTDTSQPSEDRQTASMAIDLGDAAA